MSESSQLAVELPESKPAAVQAEVPPEATEVAQVAAEDPTVEPAPPQQSAALAAVQAAHDLPPGVRQRFTTLVEQSANLSQDGEPLLPAHQVLELLAQGLPPVLRRESTSTVSRPDHPAGDAFFQLQSDEFSDQQAEQIARTQLQRAGLLRKS
ncbi:hypothetical protein ETAA8_70480 [Anatilimnocola aggregata]|uniref:Uncharacterized protein n=1 Tax=Anatilimnocola aggregata TaxID=2528021 RepID=A0A517YNU6_9BACT|nr:hypothetical protein [Anatilimnocola aggregata]QDU31886.1 hypothetical protein ETAA8_70480 [Anatilimnocola aggregata]